MYIAHSPPNDNTLPHYLDDHTEETYILSTKFANGFDHFGIASAAAIMHDQGKKSKMYRKYIQKESNMKRGSVKHAIGGAYLLMNMKEQNPVLIPLISLLVIGHHTGIPNFSDLENRIRQTPSYLKDIEPLLEKEKLRVAQILKNASDKAMPKFQSVIDAYWYLSTLTRFSFSCLIDADRLSTENYYTPERTQKRQYNPPSFQNSIEKLTKYMNDLRKIAVPTRLNNIRNMVYEAARTAASMNNNYFTMHTPTGSGKTLASLAFALHHAKQNSKRRIIFALPLTNLTEQTSQIYRSILGNGHVLEHHSTMQLKHKSEDIDTVQLATENWDHTFIVTTTIQLIESLFSNHPGKLRKIHRIANSIIIIDEYQKLPLHLLQPILSMLQVLRKHFNVTVLMMSATPLSLEESKYLNNTGTPVEIIKNPKAMFATLQRVRYRDMEKARTAREIVTEMKKHSSVLCVVNTKRDAQKIFREMKLHPNHWDRIYHLSRTMCGHHLQQVIQEMREIQSSKTKQLSIAVVATSVIEAGIDVNFDTVYRMYAPLDSIIQAAGRCNREGKLANGHVYLFDLLDRTRSNDFYEQSTQQTKNFLKANGLSALHQPELCRQYFKSIYSNLGNDGLDALQINAPFNDGKLLEFEQIAEEFQMIPNDNQLTVLCVNYSETPSDWKLETNPRAWLRRMSLYTIQLPANAHDIKEENGVHIWDGEYDPDVGYVL